jgi:hypothetical protein
MYCKIKKMYENAGYPINEDGSGGPDASQIWNGDEIGFDPNGKWGRVFTMEPRNRMFVLRDGERAPFWATMFFWTRADGQCHIPPTVVHQGELMRGDMVLDLPRSWHVLNSPSGYMTQEGFSQLAVNFVRLSGASAGFKQV